MNLITFIGLLWCVAVLVQLYYWIWPAFVTANAKKHSLESPEVSIVVCVNRGVAQLDRLLQSLRAQTYTKFELIIVHDGPDPEIGTYLREHAHLNHCRVVEFNDGGKKVPGKKEPLAAGIEAARYDWILLTDADCSPGPEWISEMVKHTYPGIEMVLGVAPFYSKPGLLNLIQQMDNFVTTTQYIGAALRRTPYMGVGRSLMYRRALFQKSGGFRSHTHLASGDDDLFVQSAATRNNTTICIDQKAFVYSEAQRTWTAWLHQKRRHLSASKAYLTKARIQTSLFAGSWLVTWIGLPFVLSNGMHWYAFGIGAVILMWILFLLAVRRFAQERLIPWFPLLALGYCVMLCTFAILLTFRAPKTWMKS